MGKSRFIAAFSSPLMYWLPISIQRTFSPARPIASGAASTIRHRLGTAETALISPASSIARISEGSNRAGRKNAPPAADTARARPSPNEYVTGTPIYSRISSVTCITSFNRATTSARLRWLSTIGFGAPSVPEVNTICAGASSVRGAWAKRPQPGSAATAMVRVTTSCG